MKKFLLLTFSLMWIMNINALEKVTFSGGVEPFDEGIVYMGPENACFIIGENFVNAGYDYGDGDPTTIKILNNNFEVIYSFNIPASLYDGGHLYYLRYEDEYYVYVTQYLFNDDDLYEFLIHDSEGNYNIYNQDGDFLGICPGYILRVVNGYTFIEGLDFDFYYVNKGNTSSLDLVKSDTKSMNFYPNPSEYGDTITVTLPEFAGEASLLVYDMKGTILYQHYDLNGKQNITIPAYRLSQGVNPAVMMDANGNIIATGKVIRK